jgi:putative DNA methylase
LVVTDPPFFDNVHYSELADFFHAWQSLYPRGFVTGAATTRDPREVQDTEAEQFAEKLGRVFSECRRVLKDDGLLAFTYHHSRPDGWISLTQAIYGAGFSVAQAHPVKAELSVAAPKSQAKEPIQLDVIFVCQKCAQDRREPAEPSSALEAAAGLAQNKLTRLRSLGLTLSLNDCRVTVISQFLAQLGAVQSPEAAVAAVTSFQGRLEGISVAAWRATDQATSAVGARRVHQQLKLFSFSD